MAYTIIDDIPVWGTPQPNALIQIKNCQKEAERVALMADHHLGYSVPIGGVVAYEDKISPSGVGFDISCGVKAVKLDIPEMEVRNNISLIMDEIFSQISFGVGRKNNEKVEHELFDDPTWKNHPWLYELKQMAEAQLGTVGSGNHYVDIFCNDFGDIWCGCHFGSRGLGHKIATRFLKLAGGSDGMMVDPCILDVNSDLGQQYIECMELAGKYAYAGRDWVCQKVASILGAGIIDVVHSHHNFAWKETHGGKDLWVVRKGATPAFPGQRGMVGGSLGTPSYIVEGVDSDEAKASLYSTIHGAGRVMGRREAAGKFKWVRKEGHDKKVKVQTRPGKITKEMLDDWVKDCFVELRGAGLDESPHCYKDIDEVIGDAGSVKIIEKLFPIGVAMAGENEFDPYKD